jgi:hypothetical protein
LLRCRLLIAYLLLLRIITLIFFFIGLDVHWVIKVLGWLINIIIILLLISIRLIWRLLLLLLLLLLLFILANTIRSREHVFTLAIFTFIFFFIIIVVNLKVIILLSISSNIICSCLIRQLLVLLLLYLRVLLLRYWLSKVQLDDLRMISRAWLLWYSWYYYRPSTTAIPHKRNRYFAWVFISITIYLLHRLQNLIFINFPLIIFIIVFIIFEVLKVIIIFTFFIFVRLATILVGIHNIFYFIYLR